MSDLGTHRDALQQLSQIAQSVDRVLGQAAALTTSSIAVLRCIDDPAAREAAELAAGARDDLYNVIYGWLNDYRRRLHDLAKRINS